MGQVGSRILNTLTRDIRNFNVENRAHKVISKEKPKPAPHYPADAKELDRVAREHPEFLKEMKRKNTSLDDRLRKVFVVSNDPEHNIKQKASDHRPLPMNRKSPAVPEFGFQEPDTITEGKVTFKQAIKFITDHQEDSKKWNNEAIAQHYKLDAKVVDNILEHFKPFQMTVIKAGEKTMKIAEASKKELSA